MTTTTAAPHDTATNQPAEAPAPQLLMLDPSTLLVDGNVRGKVDLPADFLNSLRAHGVLEPIVAVRTADGGYRVRFGQRRTLGAIKAKLQTVPVSVRGDEATTDAAEIERIVTQVHENEQRAGLAEAGPSIIRFRPTPALASALTVGCGDEDTRRARSSRVTVPRGCGQRLGQRDGCRTIYQV